MKNLRYLSAICMAMTVTSVTFAVEGQQTVASPIDTQSVELANTDAVTVPEQGLAEQSGAVEQSAAVTSASMKISAAKIQAVTAAPNVEATQKRENTVLVSPRTGMRYVVNNPNNVPIIFQTEALAPVNARNVQRIVATNPAISSQSQQKAQDTLLQLVGANQPQQVAADVTGSEATAVQP